jgi:hypothetical protein
MRQHQLGLRGRRKTGCRIGRCFGPGCRHLAIHLEGIDVSIFDIEVELRLPPSRW